MMSTSLSIHFLPLLPMPYFIAAIIVGLAFLTLALFKYRRGAVLRGITIALFLLFLANPSLVEEQREAVPDTAIIVLDQSPSQDFGDRKARTEQALKALEEKLGGRSDLNLKIVRAPDLSQGIPNKTTLFDALDRALADVPLKRRAGIIFLSDGQIHDVPLNKADFAKYGPVHLLMSGDKNEKDRRIVIKNAPPYGLVGKTVQISYSIEQSTGGQDPVTVTLKNYDGTEDSFEIMPGTEQTFDLPIEHAGQNVFELSVAAMDGELTQANNRVALLVNGVRDRMKVLLVSGKPHAGARLWRDLLTSDPGVDLVHFTILREPEKLDATPQDEMSLIAFPFRELFEVKLYDFDLIIFDQYQLNHIMPDAYFENIARYVQEGGALLEADGPSYASEESVYQTALQKILPGTPTGAVLQKPFLPHLTEDGARHPVTRSLVWKGKTDDGKPAWGQWMRQVGIHVQHGDVLMNGADDSPLLVLERVGKGRVAQLASDHIWMWARGYEGGGPYAELLRRVVHWLMKEPELDEKALSVTVEGDEIIVRNQNFKAENNTVLMTRPDATQETLTLKETPTGYEVREKATQLGIYSFEDADGVRRFAMIGDLNPPELTDVLTTSKVLGPLLQESKGGALWLSDTPSPEVRFLGESRSYAGRQWIGLRQNNDYTVTGLKNRALLPAWVAAALLLGFAVLAWWREGKS